MWEKYLLCFLPPPYEAIEIHHAEQNKGDDRRKGLTKEESKSRDTQSSEQKRDETRYFAAKGQIGEDSAWGSNYEMHMQKALVLYGKGVIPICSRLGRSISWRLPAMG